MRLRYLPLASIALLSMTACSEMNTLSNDIGAALNKVITPQSQSQQVESQSQQTATKYDDITPLFNWMEQGCQGGWESESSELLNSIMSRDPSGNSPKVTPRSEWKTPYANTVDQAKVVAKNFDGTQGYAYIINFKNASYRGVPVKSYEFWYKPESDYTFKKLHFESDKFMELKPRFKPAYNEMYEDYEVAQFNAAEKSIRC